jgi:hypothetical protein
MPGEARTRRSIALAAPMLCGGALGVVACLLVVRYSALWPFFAPLVWWTGASLLGACCFTALWRFLFAEMPKRGLLLGSSTFAFGGALYVFTLHHAFDRYGNLQALAQVAALSCAGVGASVALDAARPTRRRTAVAGVALSALLATTALSIRLDTPSQSARRAVLVWGGIVRPWLFHALWPLADRDGDGAPSRFWGVDPNDRDPRVTVLSDVATRAPGNAPGKRGTRTVAREPRSNLLWIVVDAARTDSFERLLAEDPKVREGFASFAYYSAYASCSSRTNLSMAALIDRPPCGLAGSADADRASLLEILRNEGYDDELLCYYATWPRFRRFQKLSDDRKLVELARDAVSRASSDPRALFVHLKGGHDEYDAPGDTARERYENQLRASFEAVASLARAAAAERWTVVVLGDHGEAFGEHASYTHATTLYEEVIRTPLLIRSPGIAPGRHTELVGCGDVPPKVLYEIGALAREPALLGYQYAALDLARGHAGRAMRDSIRSLRRGSQKVLWRPQLGIWEGYDLGTDPDERHNLVQSRGSEFQALRSELEALSRACPTPNVPVTPRAEEAPRDDLVLAERPDRR